MRVGIIGSRGFTDNKLINSTLKLATNLTDVLLVSSGKGSDPIVSDYAADEGMDAVVFRPYNFVDRRAPHRPDYFYFCNKQIIDNADKVVVFYDGKEKCALAAFEYAKSKGIQVDLINLDGSTVEG